jgi:hypothetical protein
MSRYPLSVLCILGISLSLDFTMGSTVTQATSFRRYPEVELQSEELYSAQSFALKYLNAKKAKIRTTVQSTYVVKGFSLIGWQKGEMAGQLLLKKQGKTWKVLSSGGGAMDLNTLISYGLPKATAEELLRQFESN